MTIKLRSKVNFPATVNATGGLGISKSNGIWTVEPDWSYLSLETVIPDASGRQLWTFDPANDSYYRLSVQALIDNLPAGPPGDTGPTGPTAGIRQAYSSTTTDSDPGAGTFRLNNATPASATAAYLDNTDSGGSTVSTIFDLFDDSTTTTKGFLRFEKSGDPNVWAQFAVTGSVVDGTGYRKITLNGGAGSGSFTNGDTFAILFYRSGDKGADGLGTGDFSSNTASSVDGEVVLFSGTGGKTGKRATGSGIAKLTSGVLSTASSGTDYAPPTSGTAILKGNGSGGFSSASAGTDYYNPGGTDVAVADGGTGSSTASGARTNLAAAAQSQTAEFISGYIKTPANQTYLLVVEIPHGGTITQVDTKSESGTCTATFKVNTTALGGTANSVSSSQQGQAQASSNTFAAGDDINVTISSNSSCVGMSFTIKYTRTLL